MQNRCTRRSNAQTRFSGSRDDDPGHGTCVTSPRQCDPEKGGSVTSVAGYAGITPCCASREGVKQMTTSVADDWGVHGITVNCFAPGWFKTAQNATPYDSQDWVEYLKDRIPLKRPGLPSDLDGAIVFLSSDASSYVTGQTLLVDGGISTGAVRATDAGE